MGCLVALYNLFFIPSDKTLMLDKINGASYEMELRLRGGVPGAWAVWGDY